METFKTGKEYTTISICDSNCIFKIKIIKRTAKTVTIKMYGYDEKTCRIKKGRGAEYIYPLGSYSMAPRIRAK